MTKHELRILYLLAKGGGSAKRRPIVQAMSRATVDDIDRALDSLEALELVSSGPTKGRRGPGGMLYWLTAAGEDKVADLVRQGTIADPGIDPGVAS